MKNPEFRFIPNPDYETPEAKRSEIVLEELYGECRDCIHHLSGLGVCMKTHQPLTYPIYGCPELIKGIGKYLLKNK